MLRLALPPTWPATRTPRRPSRCRPCRRGWQRPLRRPTTRLTRSTRWRRRRASPRRHHGRQSSTRRRLAATVAVTGTVGGDVQVGDTVTLTVNGNSVLHRPGAGGLDVQHRRCGQRSCGRHQRACQRHRDRRGGQHRPRRPTTRLTRSTRWRRWRASRSTPSRPTTSSTRRRLPDHGCGDRHGGRRRRRTATSSP